MLALLLLALAAEPEAPADPKCDDVLSREMPAGSTISVEAWGYYIASVYARCLLETAESNHRDARRQLKEADRTIKLAEAIIAKPAATPERTDLQLALVAGGGLVVGALLVGLGVWLGSSSPGE